MALSQADAALVLQLQAVQQMQAARAMAQHMQQMQAPVPAIPPPPPTEEQQERREREDLKTQHHKLSKKVRDLGNRLTIAKKTMARSKAQLAFLRKKAQLLERQSPALEKVESGDES